MSEYGMADTSLEAIRRREAARAERLEPSVVQRSKPKPTVESVRYTPKPRKPGKRTAGAVTVKRLTPEQMRAYCQVRGIGAGEAFDGPAVGGSHLYGMGGPAERPARRRIPKLGQVGNVTLPWSDNATLT